MNYLVIRTTHDGSIFNVSEYETREKAIAAADNDFSRLSTHDRENTSMFYVLQSANPDPDSEYHFDGDYIKEYVGNFYTANRETGEIIDQFKYIDSAEHAIACYELEDMRNNEYTENFYDIVDRWHCSVKR